MPEAHLLLDVLGQSGIRAQVFNAHASSIAGELPIDHALPQVWVEDQGYAQRARRLIEAYLRTSAQGPPRTCMQCGEENPPAFDLCWSCAAALPG